MPGVPLRYVLATIYAVLSNGLDAVALHALDVDLGLTGRAADQASAGDGEVELPAYDPRLAPDVPTSKDDPVAMAMLAQFGEQALD